MRHGCRALKGLFVVLIATMGCDDVAPPGGPDGPPNDVRCNLDPTAEGCPCDTTDVLTCYSEPDLAGGAMVCHEGQRTCGDDGRWGGCNSIRSYVLEGVEWTTSALITPPTQCNPCNPNCQIATDYPDDTDLTTTNAIGLEYDAIAGGLTLVQCNTLSGAPTIYTFDSGDSGALVSDRAPPLPDVPMTATDGSITFPGTWAEFAGGGSPRRLEATLADSQLLGDTLVASGSFSAEVWIEVTDSSQTGPARILTYSNGASDRAFTIAQDAGNIIVRLNTSITDANGVNDTVNGVPSFLSAAAFPTSGPLHVVTTYDATSGTHSLYLDSVLVDSYVHLDAGANPATIAGWDTANFRFGMGDEFNGADRRWKGSLHHTAIYDRYLDPAEILCKYNVGEDPFDTLTDSDNDGIPDDADDCNGQTDFRAVCGDPTDDGFYHELIYNGASVYDDITVDTTIDRADIYLMVDASGSMAGEIANLKTTLTSGDLDPTLTCATGTSGLLGEILCVVPDAQFGIGFFRNYPVSPYGDLDELIYHHLADQTTSLTDLQWAIDSIVTNSNVNGAEGTSQALYALASGNGLGDYIPNRGPCPDGTDWGYSCFEDGVPAIAIVFTDAPIANGPDATYDYSGSFTGSTVMGEAQTALDADDFATALAIGDLNGVAVSYLGATTNMDDTVGVNPTTCGSANAYDALFSFTVSVDQTITVDTFGSDYDTVLAIYNTGGTELECDDNVPVTPKYGKVSELSRPVTVAGGTYYVAVDGTSTNTGAYRVNFRGATGTGTATIAAPVSYTNTVSAMTGQGMKTVFVNSCDTVSGLCSDAASDANTLATATSSLDSIGSPTVYDIASDGTGIGASVIQGVYDLVNGNRRDISLVAVDNAATVGVDESQFVKAITLTSCPAQCNPGASAALCQGCGYGALVSWQVTMQNDFVPPTMSPQVFDFYIYAYEDGVTLIDKFPVRILVPPENPVYPPAGIYQNVYDATQVCTIPPDRPDWGTFSWTASTPSDSSITFTFRTADDLANIGAATPVSFTVPGSALTSPQDIGDLLTNAGQQNLLPYLMVQAELTIASDLLTTPVFTGWEVTFVCDPAE